MFERYTVRPHQIPFLVKLADGHNNIESLRDNYGADVVDLLEQCLAHLLENPDMKLVLVDRSSSSICDASCHRRDKNPNQLCDTRNVQTLLAELEQLQVLGVREAKVLGYSLNELRSFMSKTTHTRSIVDIL